MTCMQYISIINAKNVIYYIYFSQFMSCIDAVYDADTFKFHGGDR